MSIESTRQGGGTVPSAQSWHPWLRALHGYWLRIHPPGGLPGRRDFDPAAVGELLSNIFLVEVHHRPIRLRYRLLGSAIDAALGRRLAGAWLDEALHDRPGWPALREDYRAVIETRAPSWRRGPAQIIPLAAILEVEVLRLPLAADGMEVDMILAAALFFDAAGRDVIFNPMRPAP